MANYQLDINLLKMEKAAVVNLAGRTGPKLCVVIPVEDNDINVKFNEEGKPRYAYMQMSMWGAKENNYGDTHYIKQSFSKEYRESHSKEEMDAKPIIGNAKEIEQRSSAPATAAPVDFMQEAVTGDDLPF